jgi:uncharacterized protein (UPF0332 family)
VWEAWLKMAKESLEAAEILFCSGQRSSVSRYYYAAYQAATALLHYYGQRPPEERDGWGHTGTPGMILDHVKDKTCHNVSNFLKNLYQYRLDADYNPNQKIDANNMSDARKMSAYIVKIAQQIMLGGRGV